MGDTIRPSDPLWLILSANDRFIQRWVSRVSGVLVDLGCGRQPYRSWMSGARTYVGIDLPPGRGASIEQIRAEVHADLYQSVPLRDASADVVLLLEVLEHVPDPSRLLREVARVLRPGGLLLLATPFVWYLHQIPHDYFRFTPFAFDYLARIHGFVVLETRPKSGFIGTVTQLLVNSLSQALLRLGGRPLMRAGSPVYWICNRAAHLGDRLTANAGLALGFTSVWRKTIT